MTPATRAATLLAALPERRETSSRGRTISTHGSRRRSTSVRKELAARMSPSELESFLRATQGDLGARISQVLRASHA